MKSNSALTLLKAALWITCAFHVLVGISLNLPLGVGLKEWVGASLYGAQVDWSQPQFVYILKPLGAFMLILGVMAAIAALHPLRNKLMVYGFALLWLVRSLQRLIFWNDIQAAFVIPTSSMLTGAVFVFLSGVLLIVLLYFADKSAQPETRAARA